MKRNIFAIIIILTLILNAKILHSENSTDQLIILNNNYVSINGHEYMEAHTLMSELNKFGFVLNYSDCEWYITSKISHEVVYNNFKTITLVDNTSQNINYYISCDVLGLIK